ncbi:hypothetical protein [Helicobacter sp. T3_23-1056]
MQTTPKGRKISWCMGFAVFGVFFTIFVVFACDCVALFAVY